MVSLNSSIMSRVSPELGVEMCLSCAVRGLPGDSTAAMALDDPALLARLSLRCSRFWKPWPASAELRWFHLAVSTGVAGLDRDCMNVPSGSMNLLSWSRVRSRRIPLLPRG